MCLTCRWRCFFGISNLAAQNEYNYKIWNSYKMLQPSTFCNYLDWLSLCCVKRLTTWSFKISCPQTNCRHHYVRYDGTNQCTIDIQVGSLVSQNWIFCLSKSLQKVRLSFAAKYLSSYYSCENPHRWYHNSFLTWHYRQFELENQIIMSSNYPNVNVLLKNTGPFAVSIQITS